jgi:predicted amidohydrolase
VALVQMTVDWFDHEANAARMARAITRSAQSRHIDLVVFPELANAGYVTRYSPDFARRYLIASEPIPGPTTERLAELAIANGVHVVAGIAERHPEIPDQVMNSAVVLAPSGELLAVQRKLHLQGDEKTYFVPGHELMVVPTDVGNLGIAIGHDFELPEVPRLLALGGAELVIAPLSWGLDPHEYDRRSGLADRLWRLIGTRAFENAAYVLAVNRVGDQSDRRFVGLTGAAGPTGRMIATIDSEDQEILFVTLRDDELRDARAAAPTFVNRRPELYRPLTR